MVLQVFYRDQLLAMQRSKESDTAVEISIFQTMLSLFNQHRSACAAITRSTAFLGPSQMPAFPQEIKYSEVGAFHPVRDGRVVEQKLDHGQVESCTLGWVGQIATGQAVSIPISPFFATGY